jgi:hypothetical protein
MDAASFTRLRWRLRGAWMWPSFVCLALVDGVLESWRPISGDHGSPLLGVVQGWILSLLGIAILSAPLGWVVRRVRADMPKLVARDYAGAAICLTVTSVLLAAGIAHHPVAVADQNALEDAGATAAAYIGDHAPQRFNSDLRDLSAYPVQPPEVYRICAHAVTGPKGSPRPSWYCVSVDLSRPFGRSVTYAGAEPNSQLSQGTG